MLPEFYNQLVAMHGTIMVFLAVVPLSPRRASKGELRGSGRPVGVERPRRCVDLVSAENPLGLDITDPAAKDDVWTQGNRLLAAVRPGSLPDARLLHDPDAGRFRRVARQPACGH